MSKVHQEKSIFRNGNIQSQSSRCDGVLHGEYVGYLEDGTQDISKFFYKGKHHGDGWFIFRGDIELIYWYKGSARGSFPFLPKKPARKNYKSNRNRFQSLEL